MAILVSTRLMLLLLFIGVNNAQLSTNFYSSTCPQLLPTIRSVVRSAISADPRMGASLLRLHFSDCFVNGCDASVLLDDTPSFTGEKTAIPNVNSLRGFDVIDNIKARVERICPGTVSCADILTVAARDSVFTLNGPSWLVLLGRRDSTTASLTDANSQIPSPDNSLAELVDAFSAKGLSRSEMVTLSGAHTIGQARCTTFRTRIYNVTNLNATYAAELRENCPSIGGDDNLSPLDVVSPTVFNNDYYKNLIGLNGLLRSDGELFNDASTEPQVQAYSTNAASFFNDFSAAMIKMSNLSPLTGTNGQIRANCRIIN